MRCKRSTFRTEKVLNGKKKIEKNFRSAKRKACKELYTQFVTDIKTIKPSLYHKTANRLGGLNQNAQEKLVIECLEGLNPKEQVQRVAKSFASVSQEYSPIDLQKLPACLPSEKTTPIASVQSVQKNPSPKKN